MFKKIAIASVVVVAGLVLLAKTNLGSYAHTAWKKAKIGVSEQVPLEFEIERVRDEVSKLTPDMDKNFNAIAHEMVAIDNLRDPRGCFYYQRRRFYKVRIPYMRWSEAWMTYALARLIEAEGKREKGKG